MLLPVSALWFKDISHIIGTYVLVYHHLARHAQDPADAYADGQVITMPPMVECVITRI